MLAFVGVIETEEVEYKDGYNNYFVIRICK